MKLNRDVVLRSVSLACAAALSVWMTGCAADFNSVPASTGATGLGQMQGSVHGGQQPIVGASVALYAASTQGYGTASTLLTPVPATTDLNGSFLLTGTYTCTPGQQVDRLAAGGPEPGADPNLALRGCTTFPSGRAACSRRRPGFATGRVDLHDNDATGT